MLTSTIRPQNYWELFNLRHAQARNVIERIFGVVKRKFRIMIAAPEYSLEKQAKIILAICILHNFICVRDPEDINEADMAELVEQTPPQQAQEDFSTNITAAEREESMEKWDEIARAMWAQYVAYTGDEGL